MGPDGENYYFDAQNWSVSDLMLSFNVTLDEFNSINDTNYQETDTINQTVIKLPNDRVEPVYDEYDNFSYYKRTTEPVVSEVPIIDPHNEVAVVVPPLQAQWAYSNQDQLYEYMWGEAENPTDTYDPQLVESAIRDAKIAWLNRAAEVLFFTEGLRNQISEDSLLLGATNSYGQPTSEEDIINIIDGADAESFSQIFSEYYSVIPEFIEGNDFYEFMMFYDHLHQMEEGGELSSYTSEFDPDFATRTLLESRGWLYGLGPEEVENELIAQELMYMLGESLARRGTEGVTFYSDVSAEYMPGLYAMLATQYGGDYTPDDMVQFVNSLSVVLQNANIPGDARLSLQETQVYSGLYLSGREMDEDRQLAQAWNTDQQQETQNLLGKLEANVGKIQSLDGEILGISTSNVKGAFADLLKTSSDYVDYLKNLKNQMPTVEGNLVTIQEATEAEKEGLDAIVTMALLLPLGFASETIDTGISLLEFLATGDRLALLGAFPILPNQSDEMIDYARDARLLGALDGILPYMDNVSDVARYGPDSADEILKSLEFYQRFGYVPNINTVNDLPGALVTLDPETYFYSQIFTDRSFATRPFLDPIELEQFIFLDMIPPQDPRFYDEYTRLVKEMEDLDDMLYNGGCNRWCFAMLASDSPDNASDVWRLMREVEDGSEGLSMTRLNQELGKLDIDTIPMIYDEPKSLQLYTEVLQGTNFDNNDSIVALIKSDNIKDSHTIIIDNTDLFDFGDGKGLQPALLIRDWNIPSHSIDPENVFGTGWITLDEFISISTGEYVIVKGS